MQYHTYYVHVSNRTIWLSGKFQSLSAREVAVEVSRTFKLAYGVSPELTIAIPESFFLKLIALYDFKLMMLRSFGFSAISA